MIWWEERFLLEAAKMEKLYWSCVKEAASGYHLTPNEISVLLFLRRYAPKLDTATDMVQQLGISKALVARSVDCLYRRGFVQGERDGNDRRVVHLHLCGEGIMIAQQLYQSGCRVSERLRQNVTEEELQIVHTIMDKMQRNLDEILRDMEGQVKEYDGTGQRF
ncbi:MarR family winged helix-turn-helix transcriptional regulator [Candidatus Agathobaculum pullicola]|uniref:MarR family winged helix-turn-helix transcriptional regulator n=1 Tax=Candidatus Agathobaculum pullicola TaxID=2838426 RepID=UPI003F9206A7